MNGEPDWPRRASVWCLTATILLAPLAGSWAPTPALPRLYWSDAPLAIGMVLWTASHQRRLDAPLRLPPRLLLAGLIGLVTTGIWSALRAPEPGLALDLSLRSLLALGICCWVTDLDPMPERIGWSLALGAAVQGVIATAQSLSGGSLGLGFLGEIAFGRSSPGGWVRAFGLTPHPNILGGVAAIGVIATIGMIRARHSRDWSRGLPMLFLAAAAVVTSVSRSAMLGMAVSFAVHPVGIRPGTRHWFRLVVALSIVLATTAIFVVPRSDQYLTRIVAPFTRFEDKDAAVIRERADLEQRLIQHGVAFRIIGDQPLLGVGAGNFMDAWRTLSDHPSIPILPVHDVPVLVFAEQGLPGFLSWLVLQGSIVRDARRHWQLVRESWALTWLAVLVLIVTVSFFDFYFWEWEQGRLLWAVVLGLWGASLASRASPDVAEQGGPGRSDTRMEQ